jgi:uncharacterized protein YegJ (DUF2314 family)
MLLALQACDRSPSLDGGADVAPQPSAWVRDGDGRSAHVVLTNEAVDELSDSIEEAQKSAPQAQQQFATALPHERLRFLVLWMAPTADGSREFVWVRPVTWSPFRIEGELLSQPTAPLEAGSTAGDSISFPIEQLADWIIFESSRPGQPAQGAATLSEIEKRVGTPR